MKFRKYSSEDFDLAKSFIDRCNSNDFSINQLKKQATGIFAFSDQNEVMALAMQWRNELHNKTIVIEICVLPDKRREGIGTKVFKKLNEEFPVRDNDFAFDIKCESKNIEARAFAESLGFEKYLNCYNNVFSIDEVTIVNNNREIVRLSDFYKEEQNKERVKVFHCSMYDRDHEPYLPLNKDKEVRYDYYSDGNLDYGVVILKDREIIGCSFAYLNFEDELEEEVSDVTCLHGYANNEDKTEEALLVQELYSYQTKLLKEQGRQNIYIEFDSIERTSDLMLDWLPYTKKPLLRFQKRI
ncbi:MAG: GNAT family N-acetyltransferase [Bacteriovoracaceae bacterium]|nr:GNAT family N-acetyltransferase [Bacteriovoracaceae bacterium]